MARIIDILPEVTGEEMVYVQKLLTGFDDEKAKAFATVYRNRRRDPTLILILTLLGFFLFAGLQRFLTNQIGMGILYFFTAGLCLVGTIIDLVNYQKISFEYNKKVADESAVLVQ